VLFALHVLHMSLHVCDCVLGLGGFLCRRPLISRQEGFRPEVLITVVALPCPFTNTTLLMCPLGLQWLRHEDNQPTDSHPHRNSFALIPMISSLCLDRVDFFGGDCRHIYEVWGLWFRPALLNTSVCVWPGIPPSSVCVFKCMCLWWVVWFAIAL